MLSDESRTCLLCICLLGLLAGCRGVPAAPLGAPSQSVSADDEDGWLFKRLTGREKTATPVDGAAPQASGATPAAGGQVQAASYVATGATSPLIAGPASPGSASVPTPLSLAAEAAETPPGTVLAGPPPTIPAPLYSPTANSVSLPDREIEAAKNKEKAGFEWSDLAPENAYKNFLEAIGKGPDENVARTAKETGERLFREAAAKCAAGQMKEGRKLFRQAGPWFATAAKRWPDTPQEEDSLFLQAESEFFSDQYPKAHDTYGGLLKKYVNTRHMETVVRREFALGLYWEQLDGTKPIFLLQPNVTDKSRPMFDTFGYAIQAYERVRMSDPTGPLADHALMALANAHFRHNHYPEAAQNYALLRKEHPKSAHLMKAYLLGLQAEMRVYQGTLYDATSLKEAHKIAEQALRQFDDKLGPDRERVARALAQIREEEANRDFTYAEYYDRQHYYGAARLYYKSVIDNFPTTERAQVARARYGEIRAEPDVPVSQFAWLTDMWDTKKK